MTDDEFILPLEWSPILLALRSWGGTFTEEDCFGYHLVLGDIDPLAIVGVIRRLARSARTFYPRPTAAEIGAEYDLMQRPELAQVSWEEVWTAFRAACRHTDFPHQAGAAAKATFVGDLVAAELGPVAGSFAAAVYERAVRLPVDDPQYGGAAEARLRSSWDEHQPVTLERMRRGGTVRTPAELMARENRVPVIAAGITRPQLERS